MPSRSSRTATWSAARSSRAHRGRHPLAAQTIAQAVGIADEQVALVAGQDEAEGGLVAGHARPIASPSRVRLERDRPARAGRRRRPAERTRRGSASSRSRCVGRISSSASSALTSSIMIQSGCRGAGRRIGPARDPPGPRPGRSAPSRTDGGRRQRTGSDGRGSRSSRSSGSTAASWWMRPSPSRARHSSLQARLMTWW